MDEILHNLKLTEYLRTIGIIIVLTILLLLRWCRISSINRIIVVIMLLFFFSLSVPTPRQKYSEVGMLGNVTLLEGTLGTCKF